MSSKAAPPVLEPPALRLAFDRVVGGLTAITNKLTGETYAVSGAGSARVLRVKPQEIERMDCRCEEL